MDPDTDYNLSILGDWFHYNNPRTDLELWSYDYFARASAIYKNIIMIPGNHDYRPDGYATDFLKHIKYANFHYITPDSKNFIHQLTDDVWGLFMPFFEYERGVSYDEFIMRNKGDIPKEKLYLMAHLHDEKCKLGSESDIVTKSISAINYGEFSKYFTKVFSGHIHQSQKYISSDGLEVIYPGSQQCFTKKDLNSSKHITLLEGNSYKFIDVKHIKFVQKEIIDLEQDLVFDSKDDTYIVFLDEGKYYNMSADWINRQYKNNPAIRYIRPISFTASSSEVIMEDTYEFISFEDIIRNNSAEKSGLQKELEVILCPMK
jgi:DNA repair exonuclease SbcCD nuclease subunit